LSVIRLIPKFSFESAARVCQLRSRDTGTIGRCGTSEEKTQCGFCAGSHPSRHTLISLTSMAGAADIRVLSVGAVQGALRDLAAEFGNETGHRVVLTIDSHPPSACRRSRTVRPTTPSSSPNRPWTGSYKEAWSIRKAASRSPRPAWEWRCARVRRCRTCRHPRHSSRRC